MSEIIKAWAEALASDSKQWQAMVHERDKTLGSLLEFDPERRPANSMAPDSILKGLPYVAKDNICARDFHCTCGSKMLETFVSPYDATAIKRLEAAGSRLCGKANMDEFGMGSSTDNSALASTHNPYDLSRVAGGSSGGSAAAVAAGLVPFALGSDTGGSVRQPAMFCGVYGLKPTYGAISRYGLVAYASSLEGVGILSRDLDVLEAVFAASRGFDPADQTSVEWQGESVDATVRTVGVLKVDQGLSPAMAESWDGFCKALTNQGYRVKIVEIPALDYAVPAYYTIACAEASANLARYNGIRYGYRPAWSENPEDLVKKSRSEAFGPEVKARILLGTYVLRSGFQDQYYHKAQQVRALLSQQSRSLFTDIDLLALPVYPGQAFHHGTVDLDAFQQKQADKFTTLANLSGLPALAIPTGMVDGLPIGFQVMGPRYAEARCLSLARSLAGHWPMPSPATYPERYGFATSKGGK